MERPLTLALKNSSFSDGLQNPAQQTEEGMNHILWISPASDIPSRHFAAKHSSHWDPQQHTPPPYLGAHRRDASWRNSPPAWSKDSFFQPRTGVCPPNPNQELPKLSQRHKWRHGFSTNNRTERVCFLVTSPSKKKLLTFFNHIFATGTKPIISKVRIFHTNKVIFATRTKPCYLFKRKKIFHRLQL